MACGRHVTLFIPINASLASDWAAESDTAYDSLRNAYKRRYNLTHSNHFLGFL